jgi:hypothetical protein
MATTVHSFLKKYGKQVTDTVELKLQFFYGRLISWKVQLETSFATSGEKSNIVPGAYKAHDMKSYGGVEV